MNVSVFFLICVLSLCTYIFIQINIPKVHFEELRFDNIEKDIKILHISDYHNKKLIFKNIFYKLEKFKPDLIVITGDLIDRKSNDLTYSFEFIKNIRKITSNIFFVSGNHEYENSKHELLISFLKKNGVSVLNNKNLEILTGNSNINIIGVDHLNPQYKKESILDKKQFNIMIIHSPDKALNFDLSNIDLVLSGHTHGGQVRLPFLGAIVTPDKGININSKYDKGVFRIGNNTILYIDSGLGYSRFPLRFLNRSQISQLVIKNSSSK